MQIPLTSHMDTLEENSFFFVIRSLDFYFSFVMNISSQRRTVGNAVLGLCVAGISRVPSQGHTVFESLPQKNETITVSMKQFVRVHFLLLMSSPLCCVSNSTAVYCIWSR